MSETAIDKFRKCIENDLDVNIGTACKTLFAFGCYHYFHGNKKAGVKAILCSLKMHDKTWKKWEDGLYDAVFKEFYDNPRDAGITIMAPNEIQQLLEDIPQQCSDETSAIPALALTPATEGNI